MLRRTLIGIVVALVAAGPAAAGQIVVTLGLQSGKLQLTAKPAQVTAGGTVTIPLRIADARGTGAGWTLRLRDATGLLVTAINGRCASGSTCTMPVATGAPNGQLVLTAAKASGMGVMQLTVTVQASKATRVLFRLVPRS